MNIFEENELTPEATVKQFLTVRTEGNRKISRTVDHYSLPVVIAVGYRVRSLRGTQFRQWATTRLEEYVIKGFTLDDQRLKNPPELGAPDYFDELLARIRDIRSSERVFYRSYTFIETTGGSGPIVTFDRPSPKHPKLREQIAFQKGLHGGTWFRVNLFPMFVGTGRGGRRVEHVLWEGETTGPDVRYQKDSEMPGLIEAACAEVGAKAAAFFAKFEAAYAKFDALYTNLDAHYKAWLDATGSKLPPDDFAMEDDGKTPAFDSFKVELTRNKLLDGLTNDNDTPLWRYWNAGRPMRAEDYKQGDYYDCSKCTNFVSFKSGKLEKLKDATIGTHHAFVCKKH